MADESTGLTGYRIQYDLVQDPQGNHLSVPVRVVEVNDCYLIAPDRSHVEHDRDALEKRLTQLRCQRRQALTEALARMEGPNG